MRAKMRKSCMGRKLPAVLFFLLAGLILSFPTPGQAVTDFAIEDMAILMTNDITIPGHWFVVKGHVGSVNGNISLGGKGKTRIDFYDTQSVITESAGGVVFLNNFARTEDVYSDTITTLGTSGISGPVDVFASTEANLPPFPVFLTSSSTDLGPDIVVPNSGVTDIVPGTYRDLIIGTNAVVNFKGPGDYNFRRFISNTNTKVKINFDPILCNADNGYNIMVRDFMQIGEYNNFNYQAGGVQPVVPSVFVYVGGTDGSYTGANTGADNPNIVGIDPAAFTYRGDGHLNACFVYVPNGSIGLRGKSNDVWNVQLLGKDLFEFSTLRVRVQVPDNYFDCCIPPGIDCACITDFTNKDDATKIVDIGDTLVIKGKAFNTDTVKKVLFFLDTAVISDVADPASTATGEQATITYVDDKTIEVEVPSLPAGNYYLGIVDGSYCVFTAEILQVN